MEGTVFLYTAVELPLVSGFLGGSGGVAPARSTVLRVDEDVKKKKKKEKEINYSPASRSRS